MNRSLFVFLAGFLMATACGKTEPSGGPDGSVPTADAGAGADAALTATKACTDNATARCALIASCSTDTIQRTYGDMPTCVSRQATACENALAASGTGATPETTQACTNAIPSIACLDWFSENLPTVCKPVAGTLTDTTACAFSAQCQSAFCNAGKDAACGVCAEPSQAGDDCTTAGCSSGFVCIVATAQCEPFGVVGTACDNGHYCAPSTYCDQSTGMCAASAEAQDTCDPARTTGPWCDVTQGLYCDSSTNACTASAAGTTCNVFANGLEQVPLDATYCSAGAACIATGSMPGPGTCVAPAADGDTCDPLLGPPCLPPAKCDELTGSCVVPGTQVCQ
jgi:hypothetical protein